MIVVNIDEGKVSINRPDLSPSANHFISPEVRENFVVFESNTSRIPNLPVEPTNIFKKICRRDKFQMELSDVRR